MTYLNPVHIEAALNHLKDSITTLVLCENDFDDFTAAQSNSLITISISPASLAINSDSNGKKLTYTGATQTATMDGIAKYAIFGGSDVEFKCFIGPVAIVQNESVIVTPIDIWYIENPMLF